MVHISVYMRYPMFSMNIMKDFLLGFNLLGNLNFWVIKNSSSLISMLTLESWMFPVEEHLKYQTSQKNNRSILKLYKTWWKLNRYYLMILIWCYYIAPVSLAIKPQKLFKKLSCGIKSKPKPNKNPQKKSFRDCIAHPQKVVW